MLLLKMKDSTWVFTTNGINDFSQEALEAIDRIIVVERMYKVVSRYAVEDVGMDSTPTKES